MGFGTPVPPGSNISRYTPGMAPPHGPPPHEGPPPPPPHGANTDGMKDEDVLRFAPPEIRRIWKRMISLETQMSDIQESLKRIEGLIRGRSGEA